VIWTPPGVDNEQRPHAGKIILHGNPALLLTCSNILRTDNPPVLAGDGWNPSLNDTHARAEFTLQIRVYYEDTDLGGIVYYANYLKYMERARTEFLRAKGVEQGELLAKERRMFVVKSANIDFVSPARFDDLLSVTAVVERIRKASLVFKQQCKVVNTGEDSVVARAEVMIACLDADTFKPSAVPDSLAALFK